MPRTARASAANLCYHVLNRGNNRASVSHKDGDFDAFVDLLAEAKLRNPMRILAYRVLPNHFHLRSGPWEMETWAAGCTGCSRPVSAVTNGIITPPATFGRGDSKPFRSKKTNTFWWFCGTSSGTRCGLDWWSGPRTGLGPAWERSLAAERSRCSIPVRYHAGRIGWKP